MSTTLKICFKPHEKVLLLEDSDARIKWFRERVPENSLTVVSTVNDAIAAMATNVFDIMFLDHDLGFLDQFGRPDANKGDGTQFSKHLAETGFIAKFVVIHSWNPRGAKRMKESLPDAIVAPWGKFEIDLIQEIYVI